MLPPPFLAGPQAKMGIKLKVLDPTPACPASVVAEQTEGSFRDPAAVKAFAQGCDVLTVEIEHIDADAMQASRAWGAQLPLRQRWAAARRCWFV